MDLLGSTTVQPSLLVNRASEDEIYSVEFDYNRDILMWADHTTDSIMVSGDQLA